MRFSYPKKVLLVDCDQFPWLASIEDNKRVLLLVRTLTVQTFAQLGAAVVDGAVVVLVDGVVLVFVVVGVLVEVLVEVLVFVVVGVEVLVEVFVVVGVVEVFVVVGVVEVFVVVGVVASVNDPGPTPLLVQ